MEKKINLAEILINHIGEKFYSPIMGECFVKKIDLDSEYPILIENEDHSNCESLTKHGFFNQVYPNGECMLFPSKEQRDWKKFMLNEFGVIHSDDNKIIVSLGNGSDTVTINKPIIF